MYRVYKLCSWNNAWVYVRPTLITSSLANEYCYKWQLIPNAEYAY
jgi:hypothetical protein